LAAAVRGSRGRQSGRSLAEALAHLAPGLGAAQKCHQFRPIQAPEFEDQKRVAMEFLPQEIKYRGHVFAGVGPIRTGALSLEILLPGRKKGGPGALKGRLDVRGHLPAIRQSRSSRSPGREDRATGREIFSGPGSPAPANQRRRGIFRESVNQLGGVEDGWSGGPWEASNILIGVADDSLVKISLDILAALIVAGNVKRDKP